MDFITFWCGCRRRAKVEHVLCKTKLARSEMELQETQNRLKQIEGVAASLQETKRMEIKRLQKERDDALAKVETLFAESCFLKGYGSQLEQKVYALVVKLHEYRNLLHNKTEEVVQTRGRTVEEWEWVQKSMKRFEGTLLEFQNHNSQLSLEKEKYMKELHEMRQLQKIQAIKFKEKLAQAEKKLHRATQMVQGLQEKVQKLEYNFQKATQRTEVLSSQLEEANTTVSELEAQVGKLQGQLEVLQEKNLDLAKDKLEGDAAAQLREAAVSILKLRIHALEGDLQKEAFLRTHGLTDSHLKYLSQFSPLVDME